MDLQTLEKTFLGGAELDDALEASITTLYSDLFLTKYLTLAPIGLLALGLCFDDKFNKETSVECVGNKESIGSYTDGLYYANYCCERISEQHDLQYHRYYCTYSLNLA